MPRLSIHYTAIPVQSTPAFPHRASTFRPYLQVILSHARREFRCYAIVDSGADDCMFPSLFAPHLGLDLTAGRRYIFSGAGSQGQLACFFDIEVEIPGMVKYSVPVGFTDAMNASRAGLLGQNGFFDRVDVKFQLRQREFILET